MREYCKTQFVFKGMIADFAIHDKGDGNPHAYVLLTLRPMDEHGHWCVRQVLPDALPTVIDGRQSVLEQSGAD